MLENSKEKQITGINFKIKKLNAQLIKLKKLRDKLKGSKKVKLRILLDFYNQHKNKIDQFLNKIKAKKKIGRVYLNIEFIRHPNLTKYMDKHGVFSGGGASDQYTADCGLIEECLEKILNLKEDIPGDVVV